MFRRGVTPAAETDFRFRYRCRSPSSSSLPCTPCIVLAAAVAASSLISVSWRAWRAASSDCLMIGMSPWAAAVRNTCSSSDSCSQRIPTYQASQHVTTLRIYMVVGFKCSSSYSITSFMTGVLQFIDSRSELRKYLFSDPGNRPGTQWRRPVVAIPIGGGLSSSCQRCLAHRSSLIAAHDSINCIEDRHTTLELPFLRVSE